MSNKKLDKSSISIKSAHDVDFSLLKEFYDIMYQNRAKARIWKWLNRSSFYNNKIPLVMIYEKRIIGHAGMIPFKAVFGNSEYNAAWYIDFHFLPEFQRLGLGSVLTKHWMKIPELCVTYCNEKSIGVFEKFGWIKSLDSSSHCYWLKPFNHPRVTHMIPQLLSRFFNNISGPILKGIIYRYATSVEMLCFEELSLDTLKKFEIPAKTNSMNVTALRDNDYITWRLLESPDKSKYRIVSIDDLSVIVKLSDKHQIPSIDLLWISKYDNHSAIRQVISTLGVWGMKNGYSFVKLFTCKQDLASFLRNSMKPVVKHPIYAFYARNVDLFEKLKQGSWEWEMMDSDFEKF